MIFSMVLISMSNGAEQAALPVPSPLFSPSNNKAMKNDEKAALVLFLLTVLAAMIMN